MFKWKGKYKATNAIFLEDGNGKEGRPFKARFLQAGLVKYDFGVCLLKKETIDKFINTFVECPVIIDHKDDIASSDIVGTIKNIWFSAEDGWFWCDGVITDEKAIKLIEDGYNVSCQYRITDYSENAEGKLHNANPYDKEILEGVFEHLAIVENPRYEDAFIAVNAYIATNDKWVTVHPNGEEHKGRHLLIKDGESVEDAMHRNGWYKKRQAKDEKKVNIESKQKDKKNAEYTKNLGIKVAKLDDFSPEIIETINEAIETLPKEDRPEYITSFKELEKQGDLYGDMLKRAKKSFGLSWNINKIHKDEEGKYFDTNTAVFFNSKYKNLDTIEKNKKEYNTNNPSGKPWYFNTSGKATFFHEIGHQYEQKHGIDEEFKLLADKWANNSPYRNIKKIEYGRIKDGEGANYKEAFAEAWAGYHINNPNLPLEIKEYFDKKIKNDTPRVYTTMPVDKDKKYFLNQINQGKAVYKKGQTGANNSSAANNIITDKSDDFNPNVTINKAVNKFKPVFDYIRKTEGEPMDNETKGLFAALADALKARNEAEDEKEKEKQDPKASNEDVDKRKLIDEIGGILKGKVDEELWRTIIGKAEKIAYDKSESGTADNNKAKNEEPEPKNEKEAQNRCKNEDDRDYKSLYEELKAKVDEEAANKKAKNALDETVNKLYSALVPEQKDLYISPEKGLELGKQIYG